MLSKGQDGGGELATVVSGASSLFGWLNPFSWFQPTAPVSAPVSAPAPSTPTNQLSPEGNEVTPSAASASTKQQVQQEPAVPSDGAANASTALSEPDLRAKLRPIFEKFDVDGSGAVSTEEMAAMCKAISMDRTPEQITQMVSEADPDGSGEVDFEEFVSVLSKQMGEGGTGGLAQAFTQASSFLGILNPLSWFNLNLKPAASVAAESAATPSAHMASSAASRQVTARQPGEPRSPIRVFGGGSWHFTPRSKLLSPRSASKITPRSARSLSSARRTPPSTPHSITSPTPRSPGRDPPGSEPALKEYASPTRRQYEDAWHAWYYRMMSIPDAWPANWTGSSKPKPSPRSSTGSPANAKSPNLRAAAGGSELVKV